MERGCNPRLGCDATRNPEVQPVPSQKDAAWWRAHRARKKADAAQQVEPPAPVQGLPVDPETGKPCYQHSYKPYSDEKHPVGQLVECRVCGVIVPKGTPTYTDGLPDWDQLIQGMPTRQQQDLLNKMPVTKRGHDRP